MKDHINTILGITLIFTCVAPCPAQRPGHSSPRPRQDRWASAVRRDLPGLDQKERGSNAPGPSDKRAEFSAQDKEACAALEKAVESGRTSEVRRHLGRLGKDAPTQVCGTGALFTAAREGRLEIVKMLLGAGADPRILMPGHHFCCVTPLLLVWGYPNREKVAAVMVEAMVAAEKELPWEEEYCSTGLPLLPLLTSTVMFSSDVGLVRTLLAKGADVNAKSCRGATALMVAAERGEVEFVEALLAAGADVEARADDGATALSLATKKGHNEVVRLLKQAGARE